MAIHYPLLTDDEVEPVRRALFLLRDPFSGAPVLLEHCYTAVRIRPKINQ
jgi:hypothetical protein